jgi:membrane-associated protease RseP (regulator of RpoE activity)
MVAARWLCKDFRMIDESMDKEQMALPPQPWEFRSKPAYQRLIIMLGGVTVNFILAFIIYMEWPLLMVILILPIQI